ncbi:protein-L-isoaspartate O-methyltransferase [Roseomonas sp. NAR14]|uniref:Protein-L-isoaspartate O-methyltransferase n=1 Tax=Roseomonas acroporae TaxID=2937791 RepID=A0A9X1Y4J8_9PROT|nr:protein-L-isoaspartate O-methyltransferase [Roseomonas acroporae]MCK8783834.1 protein-L-isoaspartate O-methyltransferase [Roseomonas acroporae]
MNYADARRYMVDGQVRPNKVSDPRILAAMLELPREEFLPAPLRARAYVDEDVPLGGGRVLMEPMVLARMVQLLALRTGDRVLVVGAGTGYGAAVAARLGATVTALEEDEALLAIARAAVAKSGLAVRFVQGRLPEGHAGGAPYDGILIEGEVPQVPEAIVGQLAEGGRLVTALSTAGRMDRAVLGQRIGGSFSLAPVFDCATAPLPAFQPACGFVF